ncbi:MAG: hypothetical protein GY906_01575 [bacterium]|nr:hypothetical protein [bacterium]
MNDRKRLEWVLDQVIEITQLLGRVGPILQPLLLELDDMRKEVPRELHDDQTIH